MAITLTDILPEKVLEDGGAKFSVYGDFTGMVGSRFRIYVGPNGDNTDTPCLSGVVGQGTILYPVSEREIRCYLPVLAPTNGSPYNVYVESVDTPSNNDTLSAVLGVLPAQYYSRIFDMRSVFPRFYKMGPRNMDALEPLP